MLATADQQTRTGVSATEAAARLQREGPSEKEERLLGSRPDPADGFTSAMQTLYPIGGLSGEEVATQRAAGKGAAPLAPTGRTYTAIIREDIFPLVNVVLNLLCLALLLLGQVSEALKAAEVGTPSGNATPKASGRRHLLC